MKPAIELYSLADRVFFEDPMRWHAEQTFELATGDVPAGWRRSGAGPWVMLRPDGLVLPKQGWKIHVSAVPSNALEVLKAVAGYLVEHGVAFKFLRGRALLHAYSMKYAPRAASGKLVTIYPVDEAELERVLVGLDELVGGADGPYVLSDLRFHDGPLYVRYGGFDKRYCVTEDGERELAIERPDGTLVPDERRPVFTVPEWVQLPAFLQPHHDKVKSGGQLDYDVTEALHFSNGGGVYVAKRRTDGHEVVIKEARPHAGLSGDEQDAVTRLAQEEWALRQLAGVQGIPALHEVVQVWEHRFLVMDRVPGQALQHWMANQFPLVGVSSTPEQRRAYAERAIKLHDRITELVARVHERGVVFADLHPANIMVDDNDEPGLVDFESAFPASEQRRQLAGHAGFVSREVSGVDVDRQALTVLRLWMFMPLTSVLALAPAKLGELMSEAEQLFELPPEFTKPVHELSDRRAVNQVPAPVSAPSARWGEAGWSAAVESLAAAIAASATPDREDRLFPGDIEGFISTDGASFAHGAAGVLWALSSAGLPTERKHREWLLHKASVPVERPGFFDGVHGVAHVLDHLGYRAEAAGLVVRAADLVAETTDLTLFSGLAGIGLNLLHLHDKRPGAGHLARALELGLRVGDALESGQPCGIDRPPGRLGRVRDSGTNGGLLRGWSGPALFLLRLYEATQDRVWLDQAVRAVHRDLDLCVADEQDGTLQVDGGFRRLPYLEIGSAGIALVGDMVSRHTADERVLAALGPLSRACESMFVMDAQLFNGRAGLLAILSGLSRSGHASLISERIGQDLESSAEDHLAKLRWHLLEYHGHASFPGDGSSRLSMDFSTGNAGIIAAINSTIRPGVPFMPFAQ
ncbi:class III lanthionine synthetase LanKC [Kutzneria sp. 744]|uniref:class III lanthionine synthetase LanKC n=1 Tax=Kutzneria sp. (strain 744) TaxID=345341 RepID=UPI0003EEBC63|nr:class III lanthionine synthetase LanKC [Kutzneria sp. 744]EWM11115.1 membrane translocator [Kutzneria sp. 744]